MRLDWSFLKTRVARHIFFLFFMCALVPIIATAAYSYWHVQRELREQSRTRLTETVRATEGAIQERLRFVDSDLARLALEFAEGSRTVASSAASNQQSLRDTALLGLSIVMPAGTAVPIFGSIDTVPRLSSTDRQHMSTGRGLLASVIRGSTGVTLMGKLIDVADPEGDVLWAQIRPAYLFGAGDGHPAIPRYMRICVLNEDQAPIYCPNHASHPDQGLVQEEQTNQGTFDWFDGEDEYSAGYRSMFFQSSYAPRASSTEFTLVLSESRATVLEPMDDFKRIFPLAILFAILFVFALSNLQIKKSMDPLVSLREGTRRIAKSDFGTPVTVDSNDEFEDLATSFNSMAGRLQRQFNTLTALHEIDQVVLSAQDIDHIIDTVLSGTRRVLPCDGLSVSVLVGTGRKATWRLVAVADRDDEQIRHDIEIGSDEEQELRNNPGHLMISGGPGSRSYLVISPFTTGGISSFLVLPIFLKQELSAVIALGYVSQPALSPEDLTQARQMADQVAVALSNTRLIDELDALNVGALTALARTIDAKSPWTAGHSERVTNMTLKIARQMGLDEAVLEVLNRGGLLHDIGKIGIPAEILDKPAALSEEEMQVMRDHVTVGARILEPIAAYADVIPIVLWHHERWDGTGYPDGIAGEEIDFHARLLAAADVYDALTSHRPYRSGMPHAEAVAWIAGQSSTHFDPEVVKAFMAVMSESPVRSDQATPLYRPAASLSERP
ncbi:MAG: HD domain-containing protein [Gemmatimonadetes bacterium]|nr:HD domain-containing protein [Gemmatimonadota bacterium]